MHIYIGFICISEANVATLCKNNPTFCEGWLSDHSIP